MGGVGGLGEVGSGRMGVEGWGVEEWGVGGWEWEGGEWEGLLMFRCASRLASFPGSMERWAWSGNKATCISR